MKQTPENQLEKQIADFLSISGWTVTRIPTGKYKTLDGRRFITVGEKGAADWMACRAANIRGLSEQFYYETKAPGRPLDEAQKLWALKMRVAGFLVFCFDGWQSCEPRVKLPFLNQYRQYFV